MIYLIYGNNHEEVRKKVRAIVSAQIAKKPDALNFRITTENWKETNIEELLTSQGLFVQKYIVVFDHLLRIDDIGGELLKRMKDFAESEHIFIFSDGELTKEIVKKVEKKAEKVQECSEKKIQSVEKPFQVFSLADALGSRNKKELWVLYEKAMLSGLDSEEIHRILFWQVKAMLGATQTDSADEANLNPFVYKKSQGFARNFSQAELHGLSSKLVDLYHNARRGIVQFDVEMERFILGL
jgi:DNA polymerase III delta subunit